MSTRRLRYVHASDFHLEQPLRGLEDVPERFVSLFLDAAYRAAERVFDTAIQEQADFLLLAGDIVQVPSGGARPLEFLYSQFQRLAAEGINVYWCDSGRDRLEYWPSAVPLPPNVFVFSDESLDMTTFRRDGEPLATILGCSGSKNGRIRASEFDNGADGYVIALTHGTADPAALADVKVNYWALGGQHDRMNLLSEPAIAHYCGSPQGRVPEEVGPHGCAVVDVDQRGRTHRQTVTTDEVRWYNELLELPDHLDQHGLLRMLRDSCHRMLESAGGRQVLVQWTVTDNDQLIDTRSDLLAARLRQGGLARDLLTALRQEFGESSGGVWPYAIQAEPPQVQPSGWYEEDTVLGDLLRIVQQLQLAPQCDVPIEPVSSNAEVLRHLGPALKVKSPEECQRILRHVAALGVDLLRGDRVLSEEVQADE